MIKELEAKIPQMKSRGVYYWDDLVTNKINECIETLNKITNIESCPVHLKGFTCGWGLSPNICGNEPCKKASVKK